MKCSLVTLTAALAALAMSGAASAEGSLQHFGQSASHMGQSVTHSAKSPGNALVGTGKLVAGVAAVPFKAMGAAADVSNAVGDRLWEAATGQNGQELHISDDTVTAGPPPMFAINN